MKKSISLLIATLLTAPLVQAEQDHMVYHGKVEDDSEASDSTSGGTPVKNRYGNPVMVGGKPLMTRGTPKSSADLRQASGQGKHLVFLTGDEEYRGEEGLPMMAKILSQHHGFKCTVLFSLNDKGEIDPNNQKSLTHPEALDTADAIIMLLRFRTWDDATYKHFDAACNRGVPVIGLRTSTHAFRGKHGGFGKRVLGEGWVSHWGGHKREATRGAIEPSEKNNPIFNGVTDVFGDTDVYEAYPAKDSNILLRGLVLENMNPDSKLSTRTKKNRELNKISGINDPAMAVAWTRNYNWPSGKTSKIFCSTMGAATDLQSEGLRRLIVNAVYAGLKMTVPKKANVDYVDPYKPLFYGFNSFRRGIKPSDHALGKVLPAGQKKK